VEVAFEFETLIFSVHCYELHNQEITMIYRTFGKTGWDVSVVGLGTWNLGNQWGLVSDQAAADIC